MDTKKNGQPTSTCVITDIVDGFAECGKLPRQSSVATTFEAYFGIKWIKSTYYDHKKRWKLADCAAKERAYNTGRVPSALWSKFLAENLTRDAEVRAAGSRIRFPENWAIQRLYEDVSDDDQFFEG